MGPLHGVLRRLTERNGCARTLKTDVALQLCGVVILGAMLVLFVWHRLEVIVPNGVSNTWSGEQDTQPSDRNRQALLPNFVHSAK